MIKETDWQTREGQKISCGTVKNVKFRLEIINLAPFGVVSKLMLGDFSALVEEGLPYGVGSNIPDELKLHVADINKKYSTRFLVKSQITDWEGI